MVTPVPIPNTVVKHLCVDGTWGKLTPGRVDQRQNCAFFCCLWHHASVYMRLLQCMTNNEIITIWQRFQKTMQLLRKRQIAVLEQLSKKVTQKKIEDIRKEMHLL